MSVSSITAHGFKKTCSGNTWNSDGSSTKLFYAHNMVDGVEFYCPDNGHHMIGLSLQDSSASHPDVNWAVYCDNGRTRVYEAGSYKGDFSVWDRTDTFAVCVFI